MTLSRHRWLCAGILLLLQAACSMRSLDQLGSAGGPPPVADADVPDSPVVVEVDASDVGGFGVSPVDARPPADMNMPPPVSKQVFFIVGSVSLTPADGTIQKRLSDRGLDVALVDDGEVAGVDTTGAALIVISKTARSLSVGARFRNSPQPVMLWDQGLYDEMGMVDAIDGRWGVTPNLRNVRIEVQGNPLAAGLRGQPAVMNNFGDMGWGMPGSSATVVASLPNQINQAAIFCYETGARMAALNAPARRVGFFLTETSASELTPEGWALFDAALTWALGGASAGP
jgi:hypothetical protein